MWTRLMFADQVSMWAISIPDAISMYRHSDEVSVYTTGNYHKWKD